MGPYAYKNSQWVSFDDIDTIEQKMQLIKDYDLGGAMIWALDLDDFNDQCGGGKYPLLTTINHNLGRLDNYARPELLETSQNWIRTSQEEEEEIPNDQVQLEQFHGIQLDRYVQDENPQAILSLPYSHPFWPFQPFYQQHYGPKK